MQLAFAVAFAVVLGLSDLARASVAVAPKAVHGPARSCDHIPTEVQCATNELCTWNTDTGTCMEGCSQHGNLSTCVANPACVWNGENDPNQCMVRCELRFETDWSCYLSEVSRCHWVDGQCEPNCATYVSADVCPQYSACTWDYLGSACIRSCLSYTWRTCNPQSGCSFDPATQLCQPTGPPPTAPPTPAPTVSACLAESSQSSCSNKPECVWNALLDVCTAACDTAASRQRCDAIASCAWSGGQCALHCELRMSEVPCTGVGQGCVWNGRSQTCRVGCDVFASAAACYDDSSCSWNETAAACDRGCASYLLPAQCTAQPGCRFDYGALVCGPAGPPPPPPPSTPAPIERCALIGTEPRCSATPICVWNSDSQTCLEGCHQYDASRASCVASPSCVWSAGSCQLRCGLRYEQLVSCGDAWDCIWTSNRCQPFCGAFSNATQCAANSDCKWVNVNATTDLCVRGCRSHTWQSCNSQPGCMFNTQTQLCQPIATPAPTFYDCRAYASNVSCNANPSCVWNTVLDVCTPLCQLQTSRQSCAADPSCTWTNSLCTMHCQLRGHDDVAVCAATVGCAWNVASRTCVPACTFASSVACNSDSSCSWSDTDGACRRGCASYLLMSECDAQPGCRFDFATLVCESGPTTAPASTTAAPTTPAPTVDCRAFSSNTTCNASCLWNSLLDVCTPRCQLLYTRHDCAQSASCAWASGSCVEHCQLRAFTEVACDSLSSCDWNIVSQTCLPACARFATSAQCGADSSCSWTAARGVCERGCASYLLPPRCNAHSGCRFDYGTLLCGSQ